MIQLWKRYFFKEWVKVFTLFLGCFYFLYVLIDFSAHAKAFHQDAIGYIDIMTYYLYQFTQRADVLILFALLIATIKVLTTLNLKNEIVALVVSGVSLKKLLRPFLFAGICCAGVLYANFQYLCPISLYKLNEFEDRFFHNKVKDDRSKSVKHIFLKDSSLLVYNSYDFKENTFLDVYWFRSFDDIVHMKKLYPFESITKGFFVDHIFRNSEGQMVRKEGFESKEFPGMEFEKSALYAAAHPPRWQSISQLAGDIPWTQIRWGFKKMNDREAQLVTMFYYKLLLPLACILAVIAPAAHALRFGRSLPVFLIYSLSLFGMITFFTLVNSSVILGESQVLSPIVSVSLPFLAAFLFFGWKYAKL